MACVDVCMHAERACMEGEGGEGGCACAGQRSRHGHTHMLVQHALPGAHTAAPCHVAGRLDALVVAAGGVSHGCGLHQSTWTGSLSSRPPPPTSMLSPSNMSFSSSGPRSVASVSMILAPQEVYSRTKEGAPGAGVPAALPLVLVLVAGGAAAPSCCCSVQHVQHHGSIARGCGAVGSGSVCGGGLGAGGRQRLRRVGGSTGSPITDTRQAGMTCSTASSTGHTSGLARSAYRDGRPAALASPLLLAAAAADDGRAAGVHRADSNAAAMVLLRFVELAGQEQQHWCWPWAWW